MGERGDFMTQTMVNFRMDEEIKKGMELASLDLDPFYSSANMERLRKAIADANAGRNMTEHELIEVDDD